MGGSAQIIQAKLALHGDLGAGSGKTSIVVRFAKGLFYYDYECQCQESTIGAAFFSQVLSLDEAAVKLHICDPPVRSAR